ncbi:MAG: nucleotidyltransferase domain-containing protein [Melioribacteraceae bacterium]|nr:nucleotidyltransferase domain-containing protein [Melioribacteraceae bacterium]
MNVKKKYLFGSRAKGTSRYSSDFDIAVDFSDLEIGSLNRLKDIIDINRVDADFKEIILNTGKLIYEKID